jgi:small neutral amino acid transporter SnatA (MarC family)
MNVAIGILLLLAVVNPPRRRSELPADREVVATGAALTLVALIVLGLAGEWLLDGLSISLPTFNVAVGLVLAIRSLIDLFTGLPPGGEELPGRRAALVPVFFPVLFRPELALAAVAVGADAGPAVLLIGAAAAMGAVVAWATRGSSPGFDRAAGFAFSAGLMVLAIDRIVDGIFAL